MVDRFRTLCAFHDGANSVVSQNKAQSRFPDKNPTDHRLVRYMVIICGNGSVPSVDSLMTVAQAASSPTIP
jgi:hypothetical protein